MLWVSLGSQVVTKKDVVLLVLMKRETERRFRPFLPRNGGTRRLGAIRKVPWRKGICGQKESRLFVGSDSIGSGEWTRTIDLQVMSLMSYHCSTPRHAMYNILRKGVNVKAPARDFRHPGSKWRKYLHILSSAGLQISPCEVSLSIGMFLETDVNPMLNFGAIS